MDWLEATALFLLGWFGRKLKRLADSILDAIWLLMRCTPTLRCFFFMGVYAAFLKEAASHRDSGKLKGAELELVRRVISWADPKMKAWMERVGPGSPGWRI